MGRMAFLTRPARTFASRFTKANLLICGENFPTECRYVLEMLGQMYGHDAEARERRLAPDERLRLHQQRSRPVMNRLYA